MSNKTPVDPMDPSQQNSPIAGPMDEESTVMLDSAASKCYWNGKAFTDGQQVECDNNTYECSYGSWVKQS